MPSSITHRLRKPVRTAISDDARETRAAEYRGGSDARNGHQQAALRRTAPRGACIRILPAPSRADIRPLPGNGREGLVPLDKQTQDARNARGRWAGRSYGWC